VTISDLLTESMKLHKSARPQGRGMTRPSNWRDLMRQAFELRKQALAQDPDRTDQAWRDEEQHTPTGRNTHALMMAFYADLGVA
jgi:hypothetical protein